MKVSNLIIFGDSISTTNFSGGGYEKALCDKLGVSKVTNYAQNYAALTAGYPASVAFSIAGAADDPEADCVVLWAGTNDWFYGVTGTGFSRSVEYCLTKLKAKFPNAAVVLCTPLWRYSERQDEEEKAIADITPNSVNLTLSDYRQRIMNCTAEHICDINAALGINEDNHTSLLRDGVHPSRLGYDIIAEQLYKFIQNL